MKIFPWEDENNKPISETEEFEMWIDQTSTRYAQKEDAHGTKLENWVVCIARSKKTKEMETRVIYNDEGIPVDEARGLEEIGVKIDIYKLSKRSHD